MEGLFCATTASSVAVRARPSSKQHNIRALAGSAIAAATSPAIAGSPASKVGQKVTAGDVITAINGTEIDKTSDIDTLLEDMVGEKVTLAVRGADGASVPRVFWSVVLPSIRQSSFVLGLFAFLASWNDYLWPTIVLQSPERFTLQVALTQLKPLYGLDYSLQMGGAFLATAPLLILFIFVGRRLVSGVMDGAIKG